jgi:hypothetical protein
LRFPLLRRSSSLSAPLPSLVPGSEPTERPRSPRHRSLTAYTCPDSVVAAGSSPSLGRRRSGPGSLNPPLPQAALSAAHQTRGDRAGSEHSAADGGSGVCGQMQPQRPPGQLHPQPQRQPAEAGAALRQPDSPLWVPAAAGDHFLTALRNCGRSGSGGWAVHEADARWRGRHAPAAQPMTPSTPAGPSASPLLPRPASDPSSMPSGPHSPPPQRAAGEAGPAGHHLHLEPAAEAASLPASELHLLPPLPCMLEKPRRPHSALVKRALELLEAPLKVGRGMSGRVPPIEPPNGESCPWVFWGGGAAHTHTAGCSRAPSWPPPCQPPCLPPPRCPASPLAAPLCIPSRAQAANRCARPASPLAARAA